MIRISPPQPSLPLLSRTAPQGTPIYEGLTKDEARIEVLKHLPNVMKIDGDLVKPSERAAASAGGAEE